MQLDMHCVSAGISAIILDSSQSFKKSVRPDFDWQLNNFPIHPPLSGYGNPPSAVSTAGFPFLYYTGSNILNPAKLTKIPLFIKGIFY